MLTLPPLFSPTPQPNEAANSPNQEASEAFVVQIRELLVAGVDIRHQVRVASGVRRQEEKSRKETGGDPP